MTREISAAGVIGLGTMGAGIVEVLARGGLRVVAIDGTPELAERGRGLLEASTGRQVSRGRMSEAEQQELLGRVTFTDDYDALADVDLVVEAVPERMELKRQVFSRLDEVVPEHAILASNTSSLSLTEIAAATARPQRVVGMHFFNPAPVLKLIEVVTTVVVDEHVVAGVRALAERLGKQPVVVGDRAGFVANALLVPYLARAIRLVEEKRVSREDVDTAGRVGLGLPMGPLTLVDLIGLDVIEEVCDVLHAADHDPQSAPPALLTQLVAAGRLGRKTGHGFYAYDKPGSGTVADPAHAAEQAPAQRVAVVGAEPAADELAGLLEEAGVEVTRARDGADTSDVAPAPVVLAVEGAAPPEAPAAGIDPSRLVPVVLHPQRGDERLVEVVARFEASDEAVAAAAATLTQAGLTPITTRDRAGRVVGALLHPHVHDAVRMLDAGYATAADIDAAMVFGCGYPQGPFAMLDELGAPELVAGLERLHAETGHPRYVPAPLLTEHVRAQRPFRA